MQLRIDTLENQLAAMNVQSGFETGANTPIGGLSAPIPAHLNMHSGPSLVPKHTPLDAFQVGLRTLPFSCVKLTFECRVDWRSMPTENYGSTCVFLSFLHLPGCIS